MTKREAIEIIKEQYWNYEYYFAENDCYPKGIDSDFVSALGIISIERNEDEENV